MRRTQNRLEKEISQRRTRKKTKNQVKSGKNVEMKSFLKSTIKIDSNQN